MLSLYNKFVTIRIYQFNMHGTKAFTAIIRFSPLHPLCSYKILLWFQRNFNSFLSALQLLQPQKPSPQCTATAVTPTSSNFLRKSLASVYIKSITILINAHLQLKTGAIVVAGSETIISRIHRIKNQKVPVQFQSYPR
jgi:hypothetical protein